MGVQDDGETARRRATGQLQDLRKVSRETAAAGRVVWVRRVSTARDRDADLENDGRSGVGVTDASWHGGGSHRDSRQGKLSIKRIC